MDFKLTESQLMLKNAAREFAEGELVPEYGRKCDEEHIYPRELVKKSADYGVVGVNYPVEYGG